MATIKQVENKIYSVEGFEVQILHGRDGRDVRSDKRNVKQYPYKVALKHSKNVAAWKTDRFAKVYPGYDVEVLTADGQRAHGRTKLATVRDTYLEDW